MIILESTWWKLWLHSPQTTTQSFEADDSLESALDSAWHLKQASITCTRQMAHVSHSTSQLHIATAFHFFKVNSLLWFVSSIGILDSVFPAFWDDAIPSDEINDVVFCWTTSFHDQGTSVWFGGICFTRGENWERSWQLGFCDSRFFFFWTILF